MKTLMTIATMIVMVFTLALPAFATTVNSPAIPIAASVDSSLTLSVSLFKDLPNNGGPTGSALGSIAFGMLQVFTNTSTNGQTLRSSDTGTGAVMGAVCALVSANSHGAHYVISQTGTALTSGVNTIPSGACVMGIAYATQDNNTATIPAGASLGTPLTGSWVGSRTIYNSEASATAIRIVQCHYGVTDDINAGANSAVLVNQAGGSYTAQVTFTVVSP